jgi:hypothetical protein
LSQAYKKSTKKEINLLKLKSNKSVNYIAPTRLKPLIFKTKKDLLDQDWMLTLLSGTPKKYSLLFLWEFKRKSRKKLDLIYIYSIKENFMEILIKPILEDNLFS